MGKTAIFYLPSLPIQNRGAGGPWPVGGVAAPAGGPVHGDGREVGQNEEELEGNRFHLLPWSGTGHGGGSLALGGGRQWRLGRWRSGDREVGESAVAVQGRVRHCPPLFIGAGKAVRGDILSFAELQWPAMEVRKKSRRGLRPAGFSVDLVLCELTCRAGLLWPRRGDRRGSNGGRFGGDSSLSVFVCQGEGKGRRGSVATAGGAGPAWRAAPASLSARCWPEGGKGGR
jgi:hypothetical protein